MSITEKFITQYNGKDVFLYTLDNGQGLSAEIYNYGGIIRRIKIADKDVVLGRETFDDYLNNDGYLGAAIGRHANRIKNSTFNLGGTVYTVGANEGANSLHGGIVGFDKYVWDVERDESNTALILYLTSTDGDEGFPGKLTLKMTYALTKDNSFKITYEAESDKDTVFNPTNHSYFNIDGHNSGTVYEQVMQLDCDFYTPNAPDSMPYGEVLSVKDTPFDFTVPKKLGKDITDSYEQISSFKGYDHNFCIKGKGFRKFATLASSDDTLVMECYTDLPGVQIYTANFLTEGSYKDGAKYGKHNAVCLETQFFPNSTSISHFVQPILKKGEKFYSATEYKFICK